MLLAIVDEQTTGNTGTDKIRIRIWDKATGTTVYDSQMGADTPAYPGVALAGGSVQIQK
ncbi:MAG: hypothetical protein HYX94_10935 [Chloroflexi bacterium]|nr:hypothetical protein [Chloroflexota bacterium]